jgi:hypothetical protein
VQDFLVVPSLGQHAENVGHTNAQSTDAGTARRTLPARL